MRADASRPSAPCTTGRLLSVTAFHSSFAPRSRSCCSNATREASSSESYAPPSLLNSSRRSGPTNKQPVANSNAGQPERAGVAELGREAPDDFYGRQARRRPRGRPRVLVAARAGRECVVERALGGRECLLCLLCLLSSAPRRRRRRGSSSACCDRGQRPAATAPLGRARHIVMGRSDAASSVHETQSVRALRPRILLASCAC